MIALSMPAERRSAQVFSGIDGADFRGLRGDVEALAQSSAVAVSTSVRKTVHASVPVSGRLCMYRYLPRLPGPWLSCCKQLAAGKLCCRTAALRFRHSCRDFCEGLRPFMIALSMPAERRSAQVFSGIDGADFRGLRGDVEALAQSSAVAFSTSVRKTVHAPVPSSTPRVLVLMFTLLASKLWAPR